jgi:hypothetical protein
MDNCSWTDRVDTQIEPGRYFNALFLVPPKLSRYCNMDVLVSATENWRNQ